MSFSINHRVIYTLLSFVFIIGGTIIAIGYAKGNYRITRQGFVPESGLLSANSFPTGAQVIIDGKLVSATDDTIYLQPGEYDVEILKDGYSPWKKTLQIQRELVTQTNAQLFPSTPGLQPLTFTGVQNVSVSPDGQSLIYYTASASAQTRNGLYLLSLNNNRFSLQSGPRQISETAPGFELSTAKMIWAPDSSEVLLISGDRQVLLDTSRKNELATLPDVGLRTRLLLSEWEEEMYLRERQFLARFPLEVIAFATQSAKNVYISPDKERLLYTATASATLPPDLVPPVPSANTQPESRTLEAGKIYVYDRIEDRNFEVGSEPLSSPSAALATKPLLATDLSRRQALSLEASPSAFRRLQASTSAQTADLFNTYHSSLYADTFQWSPDSNLLLYAAGDRIQVKGYDNTNATTVYFGPFAQHFVYPWPDGSQLLILTSFSPDIPLNLYSVNLQ
ncbi:MAG: PEGA domain-containing protein [bacterium]|nr:PEGA domain-containing protein [bacterium]